MPANSSDKAKAPTASTHSRNAQLDILRGVAILTVVMYHMFPIAEPAWLSGPITAIKSTGWAGVDLFFVLSGFLVSGLLFNEFKREGKLDVARFLIRRGFKIYPAYYALFLVGLGLLLMTHSSLRAAFPILFFFCNYTVDWFNTASNALWIHCWSVSVEEHFYLLLSLTVWYLSRQKHSMRAVPYICAAVCLLVPALRVFTFYAYPTWTSALYATHLRVDALAFGVLLSYLYRHHEAAVKKLFQGRSWLWFPLAALLTTPCLVWGPESFFCYVVGLTTLYVGFGIVLLTLMINPLPLNFLTSSIARTGVYSYSIYIWHRLFQMGSEICVPSGPSHLALKQLVYLVGAIFGGIIMAKIIEMPMLALRERVIPADKRSAADSPAENPAPDS